MKQKCNTIHTFRYKIDWWDPDWIPGAGLDIHLPTAKWKFLKRHSQVSIPKRLFFVPSEAVETLLKKVKNSGTVDVLGLIA